jgi:hypothetical protein
MTPAEELYLTTMYERDLQRLLNIFGEMEPIIDAINVLNGESDEVRAQSIGCSPEDFRLWD